MRRGVSLSGLSILDVTPVLLHQLGLPVPQDLEGQVPEAIFEPGYLRSHPVVFANQAADSQALPAPFPAMDVQMESDVIGQLRALGYME